MSLITGIIFVVVFVAVFLLLYIGSERKLKPFILTDNYRGLLQQYVGFYNALYNAEKTEFESRMQQFLSKVRITGVNTKVEDADKVLIAASAIIPIFAFKDWEYTNLNEVLLYPTAFENDLSPSGPDGEIYGGMVGWGDMQNVMMLSQPDLRAGFMYSHSSRNTGIHEFVHLIDKADGATDGVPESIMDQQKLLPWQTLMQKEIQKIAEGQSIIHLYGATNTAEFFAVASEYFFEQPAQLKMAHPELFQMLEEIFKFSPKDV
jgi:Mlc titration factor MtfA (ptsG expression regulator)